jgi:hypothetical protein
MYIGIDYSINSPAICVLHDKGLEFISIARESVGSNKVFEDLQYFGVKVNNTNILKNSNNLLESSRESTLDSIYLAQCSVQEILSVLPKNDTTQNIVAIESFSFGSTGNRLAQISGYQYVLRMNLLTNIINPSHIENLWLFAPVTVKSTAGAAGKGKGKGDMINSFLNHEDPLPFLHKHPFYLELKNNPAIFQTKRGKWLKPIDDLIDAYWVLKTYFKKTSQIPSI